MFKQKGEYMSAVGFIFARGGSKGLPNKNIMDFKGKPLIAWSIEQAKEIDLISRVIVSTDSLEIATVAEKYGADVPFIRPKDLATDESPEWLSWQHAINFLSGTNLPIPEIMVSVPATSPLRSSGDIQKCIDLYLQGESETVITVSESGRNPYFNIVEEDKDGFVHISKSRTNGPNRRQDAPKTYDVTTVCYVTSPKFVMTHKSIYEGRVRKVIIPKERSIDIDDLFDFKLAEKIQEMRDQLR
jgi:N-acylneuraminate cytidylyltransferase